GRREHVQSGNGGKLISKVSALRHQPLAGAPHQLARLLQAGESDAFSNDAHRPWFKVLAQFLDHSRWACKKPDSETGDRKDLGKRADDYQTLAAPLRYGAHQGDRRFCPTGEIDKGLVEDAKCVKAFTFMSDCL